MTNLFPPDRYSDPIPAFQIVPRNIQKRVLDFVIPHYPISLDDGVHIDQIKGHEVNSRNYRLRSGSEEFLVKIISDLSKKDEIINSLNLSEWLLQSGIPAPKTVLSLDGRPIIQHSDSICVVYDFIEGDFFSGKSAEMNTIGNFISKLQRKLLDLPHALRPRQETVYFQDHHIATYKTLSANRNNLDELIGPTAADALKNGMIHLDRFFSETDIHLLAGLDTPVAACHSDFHPHNVLVNNCKISGILDIQAIQRMPVAASIGFATFKIMRQHVIASGVYGNVLEIRERTMKFLDSINENMDHIHIPYRLFALLGKAEIARRLLAILDLNLNHDNRDWDHDVAGQLMSLAESDVVFGRLNKSPVE